MERLIFLSHAKLQNEDLDMRCLRKAVLVQNALRHGSVSPAAAVVPDESGYPFEGPGRLFRTRSTHDAALETYQQARASSASYEHQPHIMVDVTDEVSKDGSPPSSPDMDMMDSCDYGVVPTSQQQSAYLAQPLFVNVTQHTQQGNNILGAALSADDEEVPEYSILSPQSHKRSFVLETECLPASKRLHIATEAAMLGDVAGVDWMQ